MPRNIIKPHKHCKECGKAIDILLSYCEDCWNNVNINKELIPEVED